MGGNCAQLVGSLGAILLRRWMRGDSGESSRWLFFLLRQTENANNAPNIKVQKARSVKIENSSTSKYETPQWFITSLQALLSRRRSSTWERTKSKVSFCPDSGGFMLMRPDEDLIKYGLEEDVWFHADKLSSAHIYLRMNEGDSWDSIPEELVTDCAQLTKANSIEGARE